MTNRPGAVRSAPATDASSEDPRLLQGIALFNEQYFFDAHDAWEDLWADTRDADRLFYQALIHAAVALYHWRNGNRRGARNVYDYFRDKASRYPDLHHGVRLGRLRDALEPLFARLEKDDWDAAKAPRIETEGLDLPPAKPVEEM